MDWCPTIKGSFLGIFSRNLDDRVSPEFWPDLHDSEGMPALVDFTVKSLIKSPRSTSCDATASPMLYVARIHHRLTCFHLMQKCCHRARSASRGAAASPALYVHGRRLPYSTYVQLPPFLSICITHRSLRNFYNTPTRSSTSGVSFLQAHRFSTVSDPKFRSILFKK